MPKVPASPREVETIRENMILEAVSLINEAGFPSFSMRRLGDRLGIAAKTIYNYFSDKDELYLKILTHGFDKLMLEMTEASAAHKNPYRQLSAMAHAYVNFGLKNPHHYNILFSLDVPKFIDYVGTKHEELADHQNRSALRVAELTRIVLTEVIKKNRKLKVRDTDFLLMQVWSTLHGIISLFNSRVTLEVGEFEGIIDQLVEDALVKFK